jgi:hypothetical protein
MKKILLLSILLIFINSTNAQDIYFGAHSGLVFHTVTPQNNYNQRIMGYDFSSSFGITRGAEGNIEFRNKNALRMGIWVHPGGQAYEGAASLGAPNSGSLRREIRMRLTSIPVLFAYRLNPQSKSDVKLFLSGGLSFQYVSHAQVSHYINNEEVSLIEFATHQNRNPQERLLRELTAENNGRAGYSEMFRDLFICPMISFSTEFPISRSSWLSLEWFGMTSLGDIREETWRISSDNAKNLPVLSIVTGLNLGVKFIIE